MRELRVRALCTPPAAVGFRLAGIASTEAPDPRTGARQLMAALDEPDLGVLLVDRAIHAALSDSDRRAIARRPRPMIVPFPGPAWAPAEEGPEAFIAELLRQAIGYRVRLG